MDDTALLNQIFQLTREMQTTAYRLDQLTQLIAHESKERQSMLSKVKQFDDLVSRKLDEINDRLDALDAHERPNVLPPPPNETVDPVIQPSIGPLDNRHYWEGLYVQGAEPSCNPPKGGPGRSGRDLEEKERRLQAARKDPLNTTAT